MPIIPSPLSSNDRWYQYYPCDSSSSISGLSLVWNNFTKLFFEYSREERTVVFFKALTKTSTTYMHPILMQHWSYLDLTRLGDLLPLPLTLTSILGLNSVYERNSGKVVLYSIVWPEKLIDLIRELVFQVESTDSQGKPTQQGVFLRVCSWDVNLCFSLEFK